MFDSDVHYTLFSSIISVSSTRMRQPLELVYWEGCLNRGDAAKREKYLKTAWGKRYLKTRLRSYLTGSIGQRAKKIPVASKTAVMRELRHWLVAH